MRQIKSPIRRAVRPATRSALRSALFFGNGSQLPQPPGGAVLREDASYSLREDGSQVLRE